MRKSTIKLFSILVCLLGVLHLNQANAQCITDFSFSVNNTTKTVQFYNASTGPDSTFTWILGNGNVSTAYQPTETYAAGGSYLVCLIRTGPTCIDSVCKTITIAKDSNACNADFTYTINHTSKTVTFNNTSTGAFDSSYLWNFGNGTSSNVKNPIKTYASAGTYLVCLYKNDPFCFDSICKSITILSDSNLCKADFTYSVNNHTKTVTFTNLSSGIYDSAYYWSFGDGSTSNSKNPIKTYASAGNYLVCLFKSDQGCFDSICKPITILLDSNFCKADFSYSVNNDTKTVTFTNLSSGPSDSAYFWVFGNGTSSNVKNPITTYASAGTYLVCLKKDEPTCFDSICKWVTIVPDSNTTFCKAKFSYIVNHTSKTVSFTNLSTPNSDSLYTWSFDGNIPNSHQKNPVVQYPSRGSYVVCLTYTNGICSDTYCHRIYVDTMGNNCEANFSYNIDNETNTVSFTNLSSGAANSHWTFGDSTSSTAFSPTKTYASAGSYQVCLMISDSFCSNSICQTITIVEDSNEVYASYGYTLFADSSDGVKRIVMFNNQTKGENLFYLWYFGNGGISVKQNPIHHYNSNGTYNVCLVAIDTINMKIDSICQPIYIGPDSSQSSAVAKTPNNLSVLSVYPVPFTDVLKIVYESVNIAPVTIKLYNIMGALIHEEVYSSSIGANQIQLNTSLLPKGIYLLDITAGTNSKTIKIVK